MSGTSTHSYATPPGRDDRASHPQHELLDVKQTAEMTNVSRRTVARLAKSGRMPAPLKLGALTRWRRSDLAAWIAAGCPAVKPTTNDDGGAA